MNRMHLARLIHMSVVLVDEQRKSGPLAIKLNQTPGVNRSGRFLFGSRMWWLRDCFMEKYIPKLFTGGGNGTETGGGGTAGESK